MSPITDTDTPHASDSDRDTDAAILKSKILIVDDQAAHVLLMERLLRDTGYANVSSTLDPAQVGALHRHNNFDLILLDLQMPGKDGFGVLDELRAAKGSGWLPVIVLTAQPGHKLRALQAGARDFINKPFEVVEVKVRIHHILEVRLLQKQLEAHNHELERIVQERTEELRISEARYRSLTELASDWYWEQDDTGAFTKLSGPVLEMLGIQVGALNDSTPEDAKQAGWNEAERETLRRRIAAREPFLDFPFSRQQADGVRQQFRVSGQPMFDQTCRFIGYRGVGVELLPGGH